MSNSTLFLFVQQLWWSLQPLQQPQPSPSRTPAAWLEDPWGSPWEVSSPDLPLSLIIATCRAALQPRLVMKGCRKSLDCPFNNIHSLFLPALSGSDETRTLLEHCCRLLFPEGIAAHINIIFGTSTAFSVCLLHELYELN